MSDNKIRIDWTDLNRPEIDQRLEQARRLITTAVHYQKKQANSPKSNELAAVQEYGRITSGQTPGAPLSGKQFVIYRNPTTFGSSPKADIYLFKDPNIAPIHATIHITPQGFILTDTQASGATIVNGRRIRQQHLCPGDVIQIGMYFFTYGEKSKYQAVD